VENRSRTVYAVLGVVLVILVAGGAALLLHRRAGARRQALKIAGAAATRRLIAAAEPIVNQYSAFKKQNPTQVLVPKVIKRSVVDPGGGLQILEFRVETGTGVLLCSSDGEPQRDTIGPPPPALECVRGLYVKDGRNVECLRFKAPVMIPGATTPGVAELIISAE